MSKIPEEPLHLQQQNSQAAINNLKDAYNAIEKLIQRTYLRNEMDANSALRDLRTDISRLISEMESRGLGSFNSRQGSLEEFYGAEEDFVGNSAFFLELAGNALLLPESTDVFPLEDSLNRFEKSLNSRVMIGKGVLAAFNKKQVESGIVSASENEHGAASGKVEARMPKDFMGVASGKTSASSEKGRFFGELGADTLSRLYNYFNALEHKYSHHQPEVSGDGNFIGDKRWSFTVADRRITGTVKDGVFRTLLLFETYWHAADDLKVLMQSVQSMANAVPKDQYRSLCLVRSCWSDEIKDWAKVFMHPRMFLFLYELDTGHLSFNEGIDHSWDLSVWHSADRNVEPLEDKLQNLMEENESFDAGDVARETGLSVRGAESFLREMVDRKKVIDLGFGTSRYTGQKIK